MILLKQFIKKICGSTILFTHHSICKFENSSVCFLYIFLSDKLKEELIYFKWINFKNLNKF